MEQMSDYDRWLFNAIENEWFPDDDDEEVDENLLYQQMKDDEGCL